MDRTDLHESKVRSYATSFPDVFVRAQGVRMIARSGRAYLDFFAGAGALNYGHNPPLLKAALLDYLARDGVLHALDMATEARQGLIEAVQRILLQPRDLDYRLLFPGPTGTNCVEAALKIARRATGRSTVLAFTNGFHGMTLGALAATGSAFHRSGAGIALGGVSFAAYDGYFGTAVDTLELLERQLEDGSGGLDRPAACLVELIQGEGGCRAASEVWLQGLRRLCDRHGMLLIVDDIQAGCGRSGSFFSFEAAGIRPDFVCLSKSLSGIGLPLSLLLLRPEHDVLEPGQHSGTFRGNNAAFVTATAALEAYWQDGGLAQQVRARAARLATCLQDWQARWPEAVVETRGRGLLQGLVLREAGLAHAIQARAFRDGLMIETAGPDGEVLKFLCPLTITEDELDEGLAILARALAAVLDGRGASGLTA